MGRQEVQRNHSFRIDSYHTFGALYVLCLFVHILTRYRLLRGSRERKIFRITLKLKWWEVLKNNYYRKRDICKKTTQWWYTWQCWTYVRTNESTYVPTYRAGECNGFSNIGKSPRPTLSSSFSLSLSLSFSSAFSFPLSPFLPPSSPSTSSWNKATAMPPWMNKIEK